MSNPNNLSIIIVNYNTTIHLLRLIKSIEKHLNISDKKIIVIDNSENKICNHKLLFKKNTYIKNLQNTGFSKAVNKGIYLSKTDYILLLNPDSLIKDSNIQLLLNKISKDSSIGAIGGKICNIHGKDSNYTPNIFRPSFLLAIIQFTILKRIFKNTKINRNFKIQPTHETEVDSLCGAFILFRKKYKNLDILFDENFFLYLGDLDFSLRIKKLGLRIIFDPISKIYHIGGASSGSKYHIVHKYWYESRKYFFKKYLNKYSYAILSIIFSIEEFILSLINNEKGKIFISNNPNSQQPK